MYMAYTMPCVTAGFCLRQQGTWRSFAHGFALYERKTISSKKKSTALPKAKTAFPTR